MVHHDGPQRWESEENSVNDLAAQGLELGVNIVEAIESRLTQLFELGLNKIVEDIN